MAFKPMLAAKMGDAPLSALKYPLVFTPKLDGIRCIIRDGVPVSRTLKIIPNDYVRETLIEYVKAHPEFNNMDGELMVFDQSKPSNFADYNEIQSVIMSKSHEKQDMFVFVPFDITDSELGYAQRFKIVQDRVIRNMMADPVTFLSPLPIGSADSPETVQSMFERLINVGFEGIMLRDPQGKYKHGRSTLKECGLVKIKPFEDHEATIVGFDEQMTNTNEKEVDELGHSKRSSKKEGMVPADTLGCLIVDSMDKTVRYEVGTGFSAAERKEFWDNKEKYLGKIIKVRYMAFGAKDKPRHATFLGFRNPEDMGE